MSRPEAAVDCECCEGGGRYPVYGTSGKLHCWITCPACEGARHDYSEAADLAAERAQEAAEISMIAKCNSALAEMRAARTATESE